MLRERMGPGGFRPGVDTTFSWRREIERSDLEVQGRVVRRIVVPRFSGGSEAADAFANALYSAVASDPMPCGYVIDFRGNGGGNMWPMLAGLSPLLPNGDLGGFSGPTDSSVVFHRDGSVGVRTTEESVVHTLPSWRRSADLEGVPVAILVDGGTLSSGEIVPIMLVGRPETRVFGTRTFGVATANRRFELLDGAAVTLTVANTTDRLGRAYPEGVLPDEHVPNDAMGGPTDPPLKAATRWLRQRCSP